MRSSLTTEEGGGDPGVEPGLPLLQSGGLPLT